MSNKIAYIIELQNRFSAQAKRVAKSMKHIQNIARGANNEFKKMGTTATATFNTIEKRASRAGTAIDRLTQKTSKSENFIKRLGSAGRSARDFGGGGLMSMLPMAMATQSTLKIGSDVQEMRQKYKHVFGSVLKIAPVMDKFISKFAEYTGLSSTKIQSEMLKIGTEMAGMGLPKEHIQRILPQITLSALDSTDFHNIDSFDLAMKAIGRSFMGDTDRLKETLSIPVRQDSPEFFKELKLMQRNTGLSLENARTLVMVEKVLKGTAIARGTVAREYNNYAATVRRTNDEIYDAQAKYGAAIREDMKVILNTVADLARWVQTLEPGTIKWIFRLSVLVAVMFSVTMAVGIFVIALSGLAVVLTMISFPVAALVAAFVALSYGLYWLHSKTLAPFIDWLGRKVEWVKGLLSDDSYSSPSTPDPNNPPVEVELKTSGKIQVSAEEGVRLKQAELLYQDVGINMAEAY